MYSIRTNSTLQLPLPPVDSVPEQVEKLNPAPLDTRKTNQKEERPAVNSIRRKPSPLWSQQEWSPEEPVDVVLGRPIHDAGLSSASATDSDSSMILTTPRTPADTSQFSPASSPKVPDQHYFLPVDQPLFFEGKDTMAVTSGVRSRPTISARTSSVQTESQRTELRDFALAGSKVQQKNHYIRSARPSPTLSTPGLSESPVQEMRISQPVASSSTIPFPTGLGIQGAFQQGQVTQRLERAESKTLPPIPLSRSTTGVPGGPAPLPTSRSTDASWKTYKPKKVKQDFSVDGLVDPIKLWEASHCYVTDELGRKRRFGEFFDSSPEAQAPLGRVPPSRSSSRSGLSRYSSIAESLRSQSRKQCGGEEWNVPGRKTVVFYIRHFWCGQCQDFTFASLSQLDPEAISAAGINVIVISNGTWRIIKRYRELFQLKYPVYVDEQRVLYEKMGMVLLNNDFGPSKDRATYNQRSAPLQLVHGLKKAFVDMPLGNPGKLTQLGGEFVVGPGLQCHFAHRMTNTSNHMEAFDVLKIAGCDKPTKDEQAIKRFAEEELAEIAQLQREEEEWREGRVEEIERIRQNRAARRQHLMPIQQEQLRRLSVPTESQEE